MQNIHLIQCQWTGPDAEYSPLKPVCCNPSVPGKSYCEEHVWLVYQKGSNLRKRHKDIRVANSVWDIESEFNAAVQELIEEGELV